MTRILTAASVALAVLCSFQWYALRGLKADLAAADERAQRAAFVDLRDRRDEILRVMTWIDAAGRAGGAGQQPMAVCRDGEPNAGTIGQIFDVYLFERARGASEAGARQQLLEKLRSGAAPGR